MKINLNCPTGYWRFIKFIVGDFKANHRPVGSRLVFRVNVPDEGLVRFKASQYATYIDVVKL